MAENAIAVAISRMVLRSIGLRPVKWLAPELPIRFAVEVVDSRCIGTRGYNPLLNWALGAESPVSRRLAGEP